jgi:hypothetical protein
LRYDAARQNVIWRLYKTLNVALQAVMFKRSQQLHCGVFSCEPIRGLRQTGCSTLFNAAGRLPFQRTRAMVSRMGLLAFQFNTLIVAATPIIAHRECLCFQPDSA